MRSPFITLSNSSAVLHTGGLDQSSVSAASDMDRSVPNAAAAADGSSTPGKGKTPAGKRRRRSAASHARRSAKSSARRSAKRSAKKRSGAAASAADEREAGSQGEGVPHLPSFGDESPIKHPSSVNSSASTLPLSTSAAASSAAGTTVTAAAANKAPPTATPGGLQRSLFSAANQHR